MIQLSILPAATAENPLKTAPSAGPEGVFAALLLGEGDTAEPGSGKILPDSGKTLPDALPAEELGLQIFRNRFATLPAKAAVKAEAAEATTTPEADFTVEGEPEAREAKPAEFAAVLILNPTPAPLAPPPPVTTYIEPEGNPAAETPAGQPGRKPARVLPMQFPGLARAPEAAEVTQAKPEAKAAPQTAPILVAALARHGDAKVERAPAIRSEQAAPAEAATPALAATPVAQEIVRPAKPARPQLRREIPLEPAKAVAEIAAPVAAVPNTPAFVAATQPAIADMGASPQGAAPASAPSAPQHAVRPHEFAMLVDRLVEAREAVRPAIADLTVNHAEFGQVSLRFGQDNGGLTVSLSNNDPGFMPAVSAAVAADASNTGDASFQGGRRDEAGQQASARSTADSNNTGERHSGREAGGRGGDIDANPSQQRTAPGQRKPLGGIFA